MKLYDSNHNFVATLPLIILAKPTPKDKDRIIVPTHKLTMPNPNPHIYGNPIKRRLRLDYPSVSDYFASPYYRYNDWYVLEREGTTHRIAFPDFVDITRLDFKIKDVAPEDHENIPNQVYNTIIRFRNSIIIPRTDKPVRRIEKPKTKK